MQHEMVLQKLAKIDTWDYDAFGIAKASNGCPLFFTCYELLYRYEACIRKTCRLSPCRSSVRLSAPPTLCGFIIAVSVLSVAPKGARRASRGMFQSANDCPQREPECETFDITRHSTTFRKITPKRSTDAYNPESLKLWLSGENLLNFSRLFLTLVYMVFTSQCNVG